MIAISYRREDSAPITGRIYDRLQAVFGREKVFIDLDSIPLGVDFRTHIKNSLDLCAILLVVIGEHRTGEHNGKRRIDEPLDLVRFEVAQGLQRNIRVFPLLIDRTEMPATLPEDLADLAYRNALRVDSGADFHHHVNRLCEGLKQALAEAQAPKEMTTQKPEVDTNGVENRLERIAVAIERMHKLGIAALIAFVCAAVLFIVVMVAVFNK